MGARADDCLCWLRHLVGAHPHMNSSILLNKRTLQRELMSVVALLEDGEVHQAIRRLRALYTSVDLQEQLQRATWDAVERIFPRGQR